MTIYMGIKEAISRMGDQLTDSETPVENKDA
jgi:hypothetical protein